MEIKTNSDRILMSDVLRGGVEGLDEQGALDEVAEMHPSVLLTTDDGTNHLGLFVAARRSGRDRLVKLRMNLVEALEILASDTFRLQDVTIDLGPTVVKFSAGEPEGVSVDVSDIDVAAGLCTLTVTFVSS